VDTAAALIVGDEILTGEVADENGPFLVRALAREGVRLARLVTAPDHAPSVVQELRRLSAIADAVVVSGGIGPTHDDVTRPAVAEALGLPLVENEHAVRRIHGFFREGVTEAELSMARMPAGSRLIDGPETGTFGFGVCGVYVLPGVPFLFRDVAQALARELKGLPLHRAVVTTERREGEIATCLAEVQAGAADVAIGSYPVWDGGRWHVRVVLRSLDPLRLQSALGEVVARLEGAVPP
jgi:molybdenum cofactor synthesis domain-containing protein